MYTEEKTPYKWGAECACGWMAVSWQWIAVDRSGGALTMALEHAGLVEPSDDWIDFHGKPTTAIVCRWLGGTFLQQ